MPIFISYSHQDREFVDALAGHLVKAKAQVWVDRWELRVGDSLLNRIESAIQSASALLVILSKASTDSEWCRKELTAGLVRELEERRVVVLPVLLEDCTVPLFLRDKLYADFRTDFDAGLRAVLESVARVTNDSRGRIDDPEWYIDWAQDWFVYEDQFVLRITLVVQAMNQPYTVLTEVVITANAAATARYLEFVDAGVEWFGRQMVMETLAAMEELDDLTILLGDQFPKATSFGYRDLHSEIGYDVAVSSRLLGEDTGRDVVLHLGMQLREIATYVKSVTQKPEPHEFQAILGVLQNHPKWRRATKGGDA